MLPSMFFCSTSNGRLPTWRSSSASASSGRSPSYASSETRVADAKSGAVNNGANRAVGCLAGLDVAIQQELAQPFHLTWADGNDSTCPTDPRLADVLHGIRCDLSTRERVAADRLQMAIVRRIVAGPTASSSMCSRSVCTTGGVTWRNWR